MPEGSGGIVSFGPFELDLQAGELRKEGHRIRLQEQPFQILQLLLESPGEVVRREEIRSRLWPNDTIVEFDHSINSAVKRLRDVLRDSADQPRYIETMARRGYRFIGQVSVNNRPASAAPVAIVPVEDLLSPPPEPPLGRLQSQRRPRIFIAALLAGNMLLAFAGAWYYWRAKRPMEPTLQPLLRLDVDLGNDGSLKSDRGGDAILSPDGTRLVYISQSRLFTRPLDQPKATEMAGTAGASAPFFSPDGQWVAFFASGKLKKISVQGGPAIILCNATLSNGGSWGEDGNIIAALDSFALSRIPSGGGAPTPVTELAAGEIIHRWPQILPGGRSVLFSAYSSMTGVDGANLEVMSLADRRRKTIQRGGAWGRYLPTGHLVYINKGALLAVPFNPDRLEVRGTPVAVLEGVAYSTASGSAELDFSRTGTLVYRTSRSGSGLVTVQWLDDSGKTWPLLAVPGNYLSPTVSPDGHSLAMTSAGDIWVYELRRNTMMRLTFGGGCGNPLWSADGRYVAFRSAGGMFWIRADGTGNPQQLTESKNLQVPWSFSSDGKRLAFVEVHTASGANLWTMPVESAASGLRAGGKPEAFLQTSFNERTPMFSPSGRWLAYSSNESGDYQVYVEAFPDKGRKRQISSSGGIYPVWSRNGRELFFRDVKDRLTMVASYTGDGDSFVPDKARVWSEKMLADFSSARSYDLAPDGKRIVALMPAEGPEAEKSQGHLTFLLNFFDELRRRVPSAGNLVYR